jgi:hypothetical protein
VPAVPTAPLGGWHRAHDDEARQVAAASMRADRELRDVADQLVRTGEFQVDRPR